MEREIIVRGSGEARVAPDRAIVQVTIDADGSSRDDAYRSAVDAAARVDAVLAQHAGEIERTLTASLTVFPLSRWRKGETVRTGWRAARRSVVEVADFSALGALLAELATAGGTISGPEWQVDAANDVYDEVRRSAAEDARRRAMAYASGLAVAVGRVNWVAEPGLRVEPSSFGGPVPLAAAMGGGMAAEEAVIDVSPSDLVVRAAVEVSFAIADE